MCYSIFPSDKIKLTYRNNTSQLGLPASQCVVSAHQSAGISLRHGRIGHLVSSFHHCSGHIFDLKLFINVGPMTGWVSCSLPSSLRTTSSPRSTAEPPERQSDSIRSSVPYSTARTPRHSLAYQPSAHSENRADLNLHLQLEGDRV